MYNFIEFLFYQSYQVKQLPQRYYISVFFDMLAHVTQSAHTTNSLESMSKEKKKEKKKTNRKNYHKQFLNVLKKNRKIYSVFRVKQQDNIK